MGIGRDAWWIVALVTAASACVPTVDGGDAQTAGGHSTGGRPAAHPRANGGNPSRGGHPAGSAGTPASSGGTIWNFGGAFPFDTAGQPAGTAGNAAGAPGGGSAAGAPGSGGGQDWANVYPLNCIAESAYTDVAVGTVHAVALAENGRVRCVTRSDQFDVCGLPDGTYVAVDASLYTSCGLRDDGSIVCAGGVNGPPSAPEEFRYQALAVGDFITCALDEDGLVHCFGTLSSMPEERYVRDPFDEPCIDLDIKIELVCAVTTSGEIRCANTWGNPLADVFASPPEGPFTQVTVQGSSACGLRTDGTVVCFGTSSIPPAPKGRYAALESNHDHVCGVTDSGRLDCVSATWGQNPNGAHSDLAIGEGVACAIRNSAVECWGSELCE